MHADIHPSQYYRLPWSLNDNVLSWLEPTKRCNLYCEGCYSRNDPNSDKSLEQVRADVDALVRQRKIDSMSIAGGEPLVHPRIVDIVRMVSEDFGIKPIINTNALALTPELLRQLKDAGLYGFTFHIDSTQGRPKWKGRNELELNELRLHYAKMVAEVGDMSVAFNCTITRDTLSYVPDMAEWAREHIDIVHSMVFILFRTSNTREFDYFKNGQPVPLDDLVYYDQDKNPAPIEAPEVVAEIRKRDAAFTPCAYLGGTKDPNSFKWLLTARIGSRERIYGYVGPRYMELVQTGHHMLFKRYLGYTRPSMLRHGRTMLAGFAAFDKGARTTARTYVGDLLRKPWRRAPKLHFQSILIIQPVDMLPDGRMNMCDGCPDMTVDDGELVWSCRLDERTLHGCFLTAAPKCARPEVEVKSEVKAKAKPKAAKTKKRTGQPAEA
ncbi:MAG: radical SAM protein [Deltaproteobacteria bacterium]|nr:radical SAM protein [Deltaproteobacteria bacterium]